MWAKKKQQGDFAMKPLVVLAGALALAACASEAPPTTMQPMQLAAKLAAANEVPPVSSPAMGDAQVTYDKASKQLRWNVSYAGLSGPATAAHFHGPAASGANAPVALNIAPSGPPTNPITGTAQLTEQQEAQLLAGQWYLNVHTAANRGGEIRGQVLPR
jgi:hypothetical protein